MKETKDGEGLPLILVFYLDRELMGESSIMNGFAEAVNDDIVRRGANIMAYFLPTDDTERVECINPLIATDEEKRTIKSLIADISEKFDINPDINEDE